MKKSLLLTLFVLTVSLLLAGCNPGIQTESNEPDTSNASNVITKETAMLVSTGSQQISAKDVTFTSVSLTSASGTEEYEVEFIYNGYKYKVDIDAITGDVNTVQKEDYAQPEQSQAPESGIDREQAIKAALEKAGLADVAVTDLKRLLVEFDRDDGRYEYDIDFVYEGFEYDFSVSASDGTVTKFDKELENTKESSLPNYDNTEYIGEDEAVNIALSHAKLTKAGIMGLRVSLERDDGKMKYEVEFYFVDTEYDYDIDAITGGIISFDRDAEHISISETPKPDSNELIDKQEAKKIALSHADVSEESVYGFEIELDYDNGVAKYEIEFYSAGYEYEYDIGAVDGKILRHSKELDD